MASKKKFNLIDFLFPKWLFPYKLNLDDERVPKLLGLVLILFAAYIAVAFTSYIFTWDKDQSEVLANDWGILFNSQANMSNWLGRLGAIVSHTFIYGGFGLPAFAFAFLFFNTGLAQMRKQSIRTQYPVYFFAFLGMTLGATLLSFVFNVSADGGFPWGGAVGDAINAWLVAMIGKTGMLLLILFTLIGSTLWVFNPTMDDFSWAQIKKDFELRFGSIFSKKDDDEDETETTPIRSRTRRTPATAANADNEEANEPAEAEVPFNALRPNATPTPPRNVPPVTPARPLNLPDDEGANAVNLRTGQIEMPLPITTPPPRRPSLQRGAGDDMEIIIPENEEYTDEEEDIAPRTLTRAEGGERIGDDEDYAAMTPYDPTLDLSSYEHPVVALLEAYDDQKIEIDRAELEENKDQIIKTLLDYKIEITKIKATIGPTVTLYEIVPAPGVRISKIKSLEDDVALSLAALGIRIIAPIPGRGTIGIEVPNKNKQIVSLKEVLMSEKFKRAAMELPIALGKTISNEVFVADLAKMPHLLIAGATGQGKSVGINTILMSILYKKHPSHVKLVLIDPKKVELSPYNKIEHHFLAALPGQDEPIITETQKVIHTLNSLCIEMDQRYDLLKKAECRNLREYNGKFTARRLSPKKGHKFLPYIILVIDEFADMIMTAGKEVEQPIGRLAQLARAVGIHLIIATQRPSVNIITGVIKANFPVRLAFKVSSKIDSRTILDCGGADQLIGRGDMLLSIEGEMIRLQCAFVDTPEVERVIDYISSQQGFPEPYLLPEVGSDAAGADADDFNFGPDEWDEFFEDAARTLVQTQQGSTSMIQRRLKLGYNRAGRIMDQLEAAGIVGPNEGSKAREVLIGDEAELDRYIAQLKKKR
jgi:DNA segregation ATPase FtsK/SpoIIIE, S-DNA-T family